MKITYKTGDLMMASEPVIAHGCNAKGVMGSGVARLIRDQHPVAYDAYVRHHREKGLTVGSVIWANSSRLIANCITQENFGGGACDGVVYVDYDGVRQAMKHIDRAAYLTQSSLDVRHHFNNAIITAVAMPLIGAGLAGGSWSRIAAIIEEEAINFQPVVYLIDGKIPTT